MDTQLKNLLDLNKNDIEEIVKICIENGIDYTGASIYQNSPDSLIDIIDVCRKYGINYKKASLVYLHDDSEIEKIVLVCQKYGIKEVLLDCDKNNLGSSKTMVALGGKLLCEYPYKDIIAEKYSINVDESISDFIELEKQDHQILIKSKLEGSGIMVL